uniref:Uncharacterized protein n=1 Tax=Anguilla anguilla TaxID=7936 RepID=A0A0E9T5A2_ANGAN
MFAFYFITTLKTYYMGFLCLYLQSKKSPLSSTPPTHAE